MKMYVLTHGHGKEWHQNVGVYSTLEKAKEAGNKNVPASFRAAVPDWELIRGFIDAWRRKEDGDYSEWIEIRTYVVDEMPPVW